MRYWVYTHDNDGEMIDDLGEFDGLNPAITKACDHISLLVEDDMMTTTVRIVDVPANSTTIWIAGPLQSVLLNNSD